MPSYADLAAIGRELPGAAEYEWRGSYGLQVGTKTFAMWWAKENRCIMKLDREHQVMLFDIRPETFQPCKAGTGTWSYVALDGLEPDELEKLVIEAWTQVVPKKISRAYRASRS